MMRCACTVVSLFVATTALAFKPLDGPKWDISGGPIGYYVDPYGSEDINDGSDVEAVKHAFKNWECVLCSSIQFRYDGEIYAPCSTGGSCPGNLRCLDIDGSVGACVPNDARIDDPSALSRYLRQVEDDGVNMVYWVEQEADWPFGAGTLAASVLGVDVRGGGPSDSDIVFNGVHHTWSTSDPVSADADVESIAAHEIGHFVGLGHSCEDENDEATCLPPSEAIMNPTYPGGLVRMPAADDREGVCSLFPPGKDACDGGKVIGEACEKNCECEPGLRCIAGLDGLRVCSTLCAGDSTTCPRGMVCRLASRGGSTSQVAEGSCVKVADRSDLPASMVCNRDPECASRDCGLVPDLGRTACSESCANADQCDEKFLCRNNRCVLARVDRGVPCPEDPPEETCGCGGLRPAGLGALGLLLLGLVAFRRRLRGASLTLSLLLLAAAAQATVVEPMDLDRRVELSDVIAGGEVTEVRAIKIERLSLIMREVHIKVSDPVLGCQADQSIVFLAAGGELAGHRQVVPGARDYRPGDRLVLFLARWQNRLVPIAVGMGAIPVIEGPQGQVRVVDLSASSVAVAPSVTGAAPQAAAPEPKMIYPQFMTELRARVSRIK